MNIPGLTIADYVDDIRRRVQNGSKAMITYSAWLREQLAVRRARLDREHYLTLEREVVAIETREQMARC